jgi:hypothetical protein
MGCTQPSPNTLADWFTTLMYFEKISSCLRWEATNFNCTPAKLNKIFKTIVCIF